MFGLVEASAGMHVRNGTFKMSRWIGLESDSVASLLCRLSSSGKKKVGRRQGENTDN